MIVREWIERLLLSNGRSKEYQERMIRLACDIAYLSDITIKTAIDLLLPIAQSNQNAVKQSLAIRALGALGERAPIRELKEIQASDGTALDSAIASAELGHTKPIEQMINDLSNSKKSEKAVRDILALGELAPVNILAEVLLKNVRKGQV